MCSKKKVYAFDFDGTLTTRDTFIEFIKYARGQRALWCALLRYSPLLVLMKLRLYPNWRAKQRLFSHFFAGMRLDRFDSICRDFAADRRHLLRPQAMQTLQGLVADGAHVLIVSASMENWVRPFFDDSVSVSGTQIEDTHGIITGRLRSRNCYGAEKVERIKAHFPQRESYYLIAYGDSRGDKEMLNYADERHYKPFR